MTQAQWAWHSFPNPQGFTLEQAQVPIDVRGKTQKYPYLTDWDAGEEARHPVAAREPASILAGPARRCGSTPRTARPRRSPS